MIGIDISDKSIKVTEISEGRERKLRTVGWAPLAAEAMQGGIILKPDLVIAQVKEALAKCSPLPPHGMQVVASIPETQSFVRVVELPSMSSQEADEAVQWAVRQDLPFDLETVYLDWQFVSTGAGREKRKQVLAGAAQRGVVDRLLQVLDNFDFTVVGLELEGQSIVRSLLPLEASGIRGVLIVDLGASSSNVIYFDRGTMQFTTSIATGGDDLTVRLAKALGISFEEAAERKALVGARASAQDQKVAQVLFEATVELVQKIGRFAREMTGTAHRDSAIRAVLLAGGAANLAGIVDIFAQEFPGVPVQIGNVWTNLADQESGKKSLALSPADATHFATAIGLALREERYF